jgi:hypothetical protein
MTTAYRCCRDDPNYFEAATEAAGAAAEAATAPEAATSADAAAEAAGAITGAGAGAGAASGFLPQAARAATAIREAIRSEFFMVILKSKRVRQLPVIEGPPRRT